MEVFNEELSNNGSEVLNKESESNNEEAESNDKGSELLEILFGKDQKLQTDETTLQNIYYSFSDNIEFEPTNATEYLYLGLYYAIFYKDYNKSVEYYLKSVDDGNVIAMNNLAHYYQNIEKDDSNAEKYYQMAITQGYHVAMKNFALYYNEKDRLIVGEATFRDFDAIAKEYYTMATANYQIGIMNNSLIYLTREESINKENILLMAIKYGNIGAMNKLGILYENLKNYSLAEKYYMMGIDHDNICCISNIAHLFEKKNDNVNAEKYYLMRFEKGFSINSFNGLERIYKADNSIESLLNFYIKYQTQIPRKNIIKEINDIWNSNPDAETNNHFINFLSEFEFKLDDKIPILMRSYSALLKQNIDSLKLHFEYSPEGKGFKDAKEDFIKRINNNNE